MGVVRELRKRLWQIAVPVFGACVSGYFVYHAIQGERGLAAWLALEKQIATAEATLERLATERAVLERRVALLSPGTLDADMLDERARHMLNFAHPDELVILRRHEPIRR